MLRENKGFVGKGSAAKVYLTALIGALLVSGLYGLPYFFIKSQLAIKGTAYHPITLMQDWDEATVYAPLVKEAATHLRQRDPALAEYQNVSIFLPPSGPIVFGFIARLVGIEPLWNFIDFFLPPLIFLLFFATAHVITRQKVVSLLLSISFIFTRELAQLIPFSSVGQLKQFLVYFKPYISSTVQFRLPFDRMFSPEWTFIPLAVFFLFLVLALERRKKPLYFLAGLSYGLVFYSYFYDWVTVSVILGILLLVGILSRNVFLAKVSAAILAVGLVVSAGYWLSFWQVTHLPQYPDIKIRTGLEVGRAFRLSLLPQYILWIVAAGWLYLKKIAKPLPCLASAIFIAAIVVMNIQLVTGFIPQPEHFLKYPLALALFFAYVILCRELLEEYAAAVTVRRKRYLLALLGLGSVLIFVRAIQFQINYVQNNAWRYTLPEKIDSSYAWLRGTLLPDQVVLSPSFISNTNIMLLTPAKVFFPPTALVSSASTREIIERYVIAAKLFGSTDERIKKLFSYDYLTNSKFITNMKDAEPGWVENYEDHIAPFLLHDYLFTLIFTSVTGRSSFYKFNGVEGVIDFILNQWNKNPDTLLKKYSLDYVYVGPYEREAFNFSKDTFPRCLDKVYDNGEVTIFRVCQNQ